MQLTLIRHSITAGNFEKRYVGCTDEPLCQQGIALAEKMKQCYPDCELVVSSPLLRCQSTAEILFPDVMLIVEDSFRECAFGGFEYKNYEELKSCTDYQKWINSGGELAFPGGEGKTAFCERVCRAFERQMDMLLCKNVQAVSFVVHGGTIMALLDRFAVPHKPYYSWQVKNCEGFAVEVEKELWQKRKTLSVKGIINCSLIK